ncbi:MAG TPA: thioredoxin family protein [Planctomycetaceae bacterium]|nr:thioredoxin family protein [Planctomycetaceae bacterium]
MLDYGAKFDSGYLYHDFLAKYGTDEQRRRWEAVHEKVDLSPTQEELLGGFKREMKVLCLAGAWCGDCVNQCPIFDHFAISNPRIKVRYFDRDANPELGQALSICGAARVPVVLFLSEDNHQVGWYGDRTLAKYRKMAADEFGPACPTGLFPEEHTLLGGVTQDWLNEFERIQLILRTSARLRKLHGD